MKTIFSCYLVLFFITSTLTAQDLLTERIRQISPRKKSIYLDRGIFHNGNENKESNSLKSIRQSYSAQQGYERIVLDFTGKDIPKIYGHISGDKQLMTIDLFATKLGNNLGPFGNGPHLQAINFYPLDQELTSMELLFKSKFTADIFFLPAADGANARLVIDVKN